MQLPKLNIEPYLDMAWRRRWWIVVPVILCLLGGVLVAKTTPKVYRASTLILVQPQQIPTGIVRPMVSEDLTNRLYSIADQVLSRTNLERIITTYRLYHSREDRIQDFLSKLRQEIHRWRGAPEGEGAGEDKKVDPLAMVDELRPKISIAPQGRGQTNGFRISFEWHNPRIAADVANFVASQVIEENLKIREQMAMGTTAFLQSELEKLRKELTTREQGLQAFKAQHMGALPDQLESNLSLLAQLQAELDNLEKRLDAEKQQVMRLEGQIRDVRAGGKVGTLVGSVMYELTPAAKEMRALEAQLTTLRNRYTEKHPDVVAALRRLEVLKRQVMEEGEYVGVPKGAEPSDPAQVLVIQAMESRKKVAEYEARIAEVRQQIALYRQRIEETPRISLDLANITRDYGAVQSRYQGLLAKLLDAQMAEELEKRQKAEHFRMIDPALPPSKPAKPDVPKILLMALGLGLALGFGVAYGIELLDPRFYWPEEVENHLKAKVLVSLPILQDPSRQGRRGVFWRRFRSAAG